MGFAGRCAAAGFGYAVVIWEAFIASQAVELRAIPDASSIRKRLVEHLASFYERSSSPSLAVAVAVGPPTPALV